jgi:hypothetical protein
MAILDGLLFFELRRHEFNRFNGSFGREADLYLARADDGLEREAAVRISIALSAKGQFRPSRICFGALPFAFLIALSGRNGQSLTAV